MKLTPKLTLILLLQTVTQAAPVGNGPYDFGNYPPTVPLQKLDFTKQAEVSGVYVVPDAGKIELRVTANEEGALFIELLSGGKIVFPKTEMCGSGILDYGSAWQADLNQDGQPDYVLEFGTGGNGLNADLAYVIFLLSSEKGFALTTTTSHFEPDDFILINGKPRLILSELSGQRAGCADGKQHSFWVYNLLGFKGSQVRIENSGADIFPKIVWYSNAPNYRETTLLTLEQKAEIISSAQASWQVKP